MGVGLFLQNEGFALLRTWACYASFGLLVSGRSFLTSANIPIPCESSIPTLGYVNYFMMGAEFQLLS